MRALWAGKMPALPDIGLRRDVEQFRIVLVAARHACPQIPPIHHW